MTPQPSTVFYCNAGDHMTTGGHATTHGPVPYRTCYDCCAVVDRKRMIAEGNSKMLPLYLTGSRDPLSTDPPMVGNWPGTLKFKVFSFHVSRHNFHGCKHTDIWFNGPDGFIWHGVNIGNTEICHCRRTLRKVKV